MKYIDAATQETLKHGVMDFLKLSEPDMVQLFISIYI